MSSGSSTQPKKHNDAEAADLDAARGLLPAVVVGAALWAIAFAIAALMRG